MQSTRLQSTCFNFMVYFVFLVYISFYTIPWPCGVYRLIQVLSPHELNFNFHFNYLDLNQPTTFVRLSANELIYVFTTMS